MEPLNRFLTILTIGVVGGIVYTLATHPQVISDSAGGLNQLYSTAAATTLGTAHQTGG